MAASPMFAGQYRSKPQVSLRGASRQVERGGLLERAHKERESRENVRRQKLAAVSIQALYRGHRVRRVLYAQFRSNFDQLYASCSSTSDVLVLCRLALVFYSKDIDQDRLIKLCQKWIQFRSDFSGLVCSSDVCLLHLLHLLLHSLDSLSSPQLTPTLPLRTIEIFLDPQTYPSQESSRIIRWLNSHLIRKHFFRSLLILLERKVPPPQELDATPSPLGTSLLCYLTRPLISDLDDRNMYEALANEILTSSSSPHINYLVLPHLLNSDLNVPLLIQSISGGVVKGGVSASLELLYAVLQLFHSRLTSPTMDDKLLLDYLKLLSLLLDRTSPSHMTREESDEDSMSVDGGGDEDPLSSREAMLHYCLTTIGGDQIPKCLHAKKPPSLPLLDELCSVCYQLICHSHSLPYQKTRLFQMLALDQDLFRPLWSKLSQMIITRTFGEPLLCLQQLSRGLSLPSPQGVAMVEGLSTFSVLFTLYLSTLHDAEFYREREVPVMSHMPFSLSELAAMAVVLRDIFISLHMERHLPPTYSLSRSVAPPITKPHPQEWTKMKDLLLEVLCALYQRDCRRPFCPEGHWVAPGLLTSSIPPELFLQNQEEEEEEKGGGVSAPPHILKQAELLWTAPFVFPFVERVKFFRTLVACDRTNIQGQHQEFLLGPSHSLTIRRDHVYTDAFSELARDADLRKKLRVTFVNSQGLSEPGIDGGGVFREFLNEVLKMGFDPNRGYFSTTPDGQLYPNPQSHLINEDYDLHYRFLGSMLGKSMYEFQLVELPFAGFFLCKLAESGRGFVGAHHLASFDPDLYRNLLSLKYYDGVIEDLALNFTVTTDELGHSKVYELKRGGTDISLTKSNSVEYIHLMAHYRLNVQLHRQFQAFRSGLEAVIPSKWLRLFSQNELQVLISGAEVPINIEDLRQNTSYLGEYKEDHSSICLFWEVVSSFSEHEKRQLLKFVTSCSRPPLLGFKELHPSFKISPGVGGGHLPSASTCMNLLKLPLFTDKQTMKEKLLYAIQSGAGFELS